MWCHGECHGVSHSVKEYGRVFSDSVVFNLPKAYKQA